MPTINKIVYLYLYQSCGGTKKNWFAFTRTKRSSTWQPLWIYNESRLLKVWKIGICTKSFVLNIFEAECAHESGLPGLFPCL